MSEVGPSVTVELVFQGRRELQRLPSEAVRGLSAKELLKCSGCKEIHFCSRSCQREAWREHKAECTESVATESLEAERVKLRALRKRFEAPKARQNCSEGELRRVFDAFESFVERWTRIKGLGRPHLGLGHSMVQEAVMFAIPMGVLLLWRLSGEKRAGLRAELFGRLMKLVHLQLRQVRLVVPRFHIAHWTALRQVHGLLLSGGEEDRLASALRQELLRCSDVAKVFDSAAAEALEVKGGADLYAQLALDPTALKDWKTLIIRYKKIE